ncbi:molybdate ABC transporter substrate-binding protein [Halodesulfovibrio aestuarii]|uniref:molybdate ABC transporter substrate-binding protein n=1 Tax=Halodesulfovibrio aestuarii TaxID=126333 RepID=UPI000422FD01
MLKKKFTICVLLLMVFAVVAQAGATSKVGKVSIACAANFTNTLKKLAAEYEKTGAKVTCVFGSTGMLYGQIINGAPFDIFFAADEKRPAMLFDKNIALQPKVYAQGKAVLWSMKPELMSLPTWTDVLVSPHLVHLGISNPKTAPYGATADASLRGAQLYSEVESKIAVGKSVGTAFQYGYTGVADATFIALSQALSEKGLQGKYWDIPNSNKINQAACILRSGDVESAKRFMKWIESKEARYIISRYGYE